MDLRPWNAKRACHLHDPLGGVMVYPRPDSSLDKLMLSFVVKQESFISTERVEDHPLGLHSGPVQPGSAQFRSHSVVLQLDRS